MKFASRASCIAIVMAAGLAATPAWACGTGAGEQPAAWQAQPGSAGALFHRADYTDSRTIVGMWQFRFTSGGQQADFGYVQWHSDGTELMNSGSRAPATENFCMGVWKEVAPARYHLTHYALGYDESGVLNAKVVIKEDVTVAPGGMSYSGPFTQTVYDPKTNAQLVQISGQVTAQRLVAN